MLYGLIRARHATTRSLRSHVAAQQRTLLTLAIETSCDDTCVAILSTRGHRSHVSEKSSPQTEATLHFNEKITAKNNQYGGIHPIESLESHSNNLAGLIDRSIQYLPEPGSETPLSQQIWNRNGTPHQKPDFISVTRGPGMRSNLNVGIDTARGLATAWQIPLVGVHHMQAHALTPRLVHALQNSTQDDNSQPSFPFLTLLVSGGHTMLLQSQSLTDHTIVANTTDIAIGDCLDKCGRSILPASITSSCPDTSYGKYLTEYAFPSGEFSSYPIPKTRQDEINKPPNQYGWSLQTALAQTRDLKFCFAGLPSRIAALTSSTRSQGAIVANEERRLLARTVLGTAFEHLASRTIIALDTLAHRHRTQYDAASSTPVSTLVVSGGVAASPYLRYFLRQMLDVRGYMNVKLIFPPIDLCTDNAAMIAWAGIEMFQAGWRTDMSKCDAKRKWSMDSGNENGGVLGVDGWIQENTLNL